MVRRYTRDQYQNAARGPALPQTRLTEHDVRRIRAGGLERTAREWAAELGVHHRTVEKVRHYETWRWVR